MTKTAVREQITHRWYTRPVLFVTGVNRALRFYIDTLAFEKRWHEGAGAAYLSHRLRRALTPDAPFRFVNVARWSSMAHFQAAHDAGFREFVEQPAWSAFQPHPVLYEVEPTHRFALSVNLEIKVRVARDPGATRKSRTLRGA
jgi:hypothetical protein